MAGRVLEHLDAATLKLADLKVLVLDEADRMLGADFEMESRAIVQHAPKARQTLFFSATFPDTVRGLSRPLQPIPKQIAVAAPGTAPGSHTLFECTPDRHAAPPAQLPRPK